MLRKVSCRCSWTGRIRLREVRVAKSAGYHFTSYEQPAKNDRRPECSGIGLARFRVCFRQWIVAPSKVYASWRLRGVCTSLG
jgi:hypothetical protein